MNLVQVKTNIHDFERCERDVILFILDYLTEKYTHWGRGGGGDFSIGIRSRKRSLGSSNVKIFKGRSSLFRKTMLQ